MVTKQMNEPISHKNFTLQGKGVMRYLGGRPDLLLVSDVGTNTLGNRRVKEILDSYQFPSSMYVSFLFWEP